MMTTLITLLVIGGIGYWILKIVKRSQSEFETKEQMQKEMFLNETKALLEIDSSASGHSTTGTTVLKTAKHTQSVPKFQNSAEDLIEFAMKTLKEEGYSMSSLERVSGIDLIGIKDGEIVYVRCAKSNRDISVTDLKNFMADCVIYSESQPLFSDRKARRIYMSTRPLDEDASIFINDNGRSIEWSAGI